MAIAHGFNNLVPTVPEMNTIGAEQPLNQLTELLRLEVAMAGYTEVRISNLYMGFISCFRHAFPFLLGYFNVFNAWLH